MKEQIKTLKDIEHKVELGSNVYAEIDLKLAVIKVIKTKLDWLLTQPSMFKIKKIEERNIVFEGFSPEGNEFEERAKGWAMGLILFNNINMEDLK